MSAKPRPESSNILGVSMPLELKLRIKRLADAEDRTMAKWAARKLREIVEQLEAEQLEAEQANKLRSLDDPPGKTQHGKKA